MLGLEELLQECLICGPYYRKKCHLRKNGYMVDKPNDYNSSKYGSTQTHGWHDVTVYYKYGSVWYI
mgnify:CR=1 FL=1|tara:strand:+ start:2901 stop:3098 length:198 start_codon:yes stop_codon:yes gene_type:complete